jgi:uncharacterized protein
VRNAIRALSFKAEMWIVLGGAFGIFVLSGIASILNRRAPPPSISEHGLESLLVYETLVLLVLGAFLHLRDWTLTRIGLRPQFRDTLIGVGLAATTYAAYVVSWVAVSAVHLQPTYLGGSNSLVKAGLLLPVVVAVSCLNAVFEEVFVCGYLITAAREKGRLSVGVNASVAIRLAYHLYQGGMGVIGIIPFGLICALWYARTARLWPVVIAHVVIDLTGLLEFVG